MKRTHIFLPDPVSDHLKRLSEKTGMSVAEHIRRAVDDYLKVHGIRRIVHEVGTIQLGEKSEPRSKT